MINVGNHNLPEEIILSVESLQDGNFVVTYDYEGENRSDTTFNQFDREDVRNLLKRRPELAVDNNNKTEIPLEDLEKATREVFEAHGESMTFKQDTVYGEAKWCFHVAKRCLAVESDKATAIKKALHKSGFIHEVVEKLKQRP
jgi:hypothetical protein